MKQIAISVIIPVYNVEKYLHRCIDSILNQTFPDFELLLIDDGSTDNSGRICDDYAKKDNRIKVFHKSNGGVSSARNLGLDEAQGDFIAFCDSDDWVSFDMYEKLYVKAILSKAEIVYCDFYMHYGSDDNQVYKTISPSKDKTVFLRNYMSSFTVMWNMLVKRDLYDVYNLRFPLHIVYREDYHLSIRLYHYAKVIEKVSIPLYYYDRSNLNSALHQRAKRKVNDELICDLDIVSFFIKEKVIDRYKDKVSWGILRDKQNLVLDAKTHKDFLSIYPESHVYIWSCPFIGIKMKCMMWLLVNHLGFLVKGINVVRYILGR